MPFTMLVTHSCDVIELLRNVTEEHDFICREQVQLPQLIAPVPMDLEVTTISRVHRRAVLWRR